MIPNSEKSLKPEQQGLFFTTLGHFEISGFFSGRKGLLARTGMLPDCNRCLPQGWGWKAKCHPAWFMKGSPSCQLLKKVHCPFPSTELEVRPHLTQPLPSGGLSSSLTLLWARGWRRWPAVSSDLNLPMIRYGFHGKGFLEAGKKGRPSPQETEAHTCSDFGREPDKPSKLPSVIQQSSAWQDQTPRGQTPSRFLQGITVREWVTPIAAFESCCRGCLLPLLTS